MSAPGRTALLAAILAGILVGGAGRLTAQARSAPRFASPGAQAAPWSPRSGRAVAADSSEDPMAIAAGGLVGGAVGAGVGALAGYYLSGGSTICGDDACGLLGGVLGFLIGEPIGMGLGAHVANAGRGIGALDVLGAAGTGYLLGLVAAQARSPALLGVAVLVQVGATVAIERSTGRARER